MFTYYIWNHVLIYSKVSYLFIDRNSVATYTDEEKSHILSMDHDFLSKPIVFLYCLLWGIILLAASLGQYQKYSIVKSVYAQSNPKIIARKALESRGLFDDVSGIIIFENAGHQKVFRQDWLTGVTGLFGNNLSLKASDIEDVIISDVIHNKKSQSLSIVRVTGSYCPTHFAHKTKYKFKPRRFSVEFTLIKKNNIWRIKKWIFYAR
jgi:hypothetical protein